MDRFGIGFSNNLKMNGDLMTPKSLITIIILIIPAKMSREFPVWQGLMVAEWAGPLELMKCPILVQLLSEWNSTLSIVFLVMERVALEVE